MTKQIAIDITCDISQRLTVDNRLRFLFQRLSKICALVLSLSIGQAAFADNSIAIKSRAMFGMEIGQSVTPSEYEGDIESSLTISYDPHKTLLGQSFDYSAIVSPITLRVSTLSALTYFESQEEAREAVFMLNRIASKLFRTTPEIWSSRRKQNHIGMEISTHKLQDRIELQIFYIHRAERPSKKHAAMAMLINHATQSDLEQECIKWRRKELTKFDGLVYGTPTDKYSETVGSELELAKNMKIVRYLAGQTIFCSLKWMRVVDSIQPVGKLIGVELTNNDNSLDYDSTKRKARKITKELELEYDNFAFWDRQCSAWTMIFPANNGRLTVKPDKLGVIRIEAFAIGIIKSKGNDK